MVLHCMYIEDTKLNYISSRQISHVPFFILDTRNWRPSELSLFEREIKSFASPSNRVEELHANAITLLRIEDTDGNEISPQIW